MTTMFPSPESGFTDYYSGPKESPTGVPKTCMTINPPDEIDLPVKQCTIEVTPCSVTITSAMLS
jgi:hypothetical protein